MIKSNPASSDPDWIPRFKKTHKNFEKLKVLFRVSDTFPRAWKPLLCIRKDLRLNSNIGIS